MERFKKSKFNIFKSEQIKEQTEADKDKDNSNKGLDFSGSIPYGRRLKRVPIVIEVMYEGFSEVVSCKIVKERWIKFKTSHGIKREIIIGDPPVICEFTQGRIIRRRKRQMKFYAGHDAEATHNPKRTEYDIPVIENIVKMTKAITKGDILEAAAEKVDVRATFWKMFPWIVQIVTIFLFLFAFQIQPNMK